MCIEVFRVSDDTGGLFGGSYSAVRPHAVENSLRESVGWQVESVIHRQRKIGHIVGDSYGEEASTGRTESLVIDSFYHCGAEFFARQPVAATHHDEFAATCHSGSGYIFKQRLTFSPCLFGAVEGYDHFRR